MKIIGFILTLSVFTFVQCGSPKAVEVGNKDSQNLEIAVNDQQKPTSIKEQVQKGAFLVDVRTPEEFASGSVKGAVNIPLNEVQNRVKEFEGKPSVIVFCRSGNRSGQAKGILESNGIKNVTNGINVDHMNKELQ